ncbi:MAG TPA: DUF3095 family protein [Rhodospirillaceae bacterium]|nr:DUF3095 family protein [Rhodospirillaceae bacterium]
MGGSFYEALTPIAAIDGSFDDSRYVAVPADWLLAVADIRGSTAAVAEGRHADVNFAAAAMIAGLTNRFGTIPFQFTGDGAVALLPPEMAEAARRELARSRGFARRQLSLDLRVGLVAVGVLGDRGASLSVGRYQPSPGNSYALFAGDAVQALEAALKDRGEPALAALAAVAEDLDDGEDPDLTGLSCRWDPLKAVRGRMVSLVIEGPGLASLHAELLALAKVPALSAGEAASLSYHWPPGRLWLEAKARAQGRALAVVMAGLLLETLFMLLVFRLRLPLGRFDPERYRREIITNLIDFSRSGDLLNLVFDCPLEQIPAVRRHLEERSRRGELAFGMHVADFAVMTCLVASAADGRHIHFVDGGDGGYTRAATELKEKRLTALSSSP